MRSEPHDNDLATRARATEQQRSAALLRAATDLFALDTVHDIDQQRRFEALAVHFLPLISRDDCAYVAAQLAAHPDAPRAVICSLAREVIEVAEPVLLRSPVLTEVDLLATIATTGAEHHRVIAQRPDLTPDLRHALKLADAATKAESDARAARVQPTFYYASTTRDPWRFLSLDHKARRRLIAEIASREPLPEERANAATAIDRAFHSILGAARIVGYARSGQLPAIIKTIAESLELPADLVSVALTDAGGEALAIMLKALRLDNEQARQVLLLASPAGRETTAFFPLSDLYSGMEPEVAEKIVTAWRHAAIGSRRQDAGHQPHFAENSASRANTAHPTPAVAPEAQRARRA